MRFALQEHKLQFCQEIRDVVDKVRDDMVAVEAKGQDMAVMGSIVRGVHTIKGSSRVFELRELEQFAQQFERLLTMVLRGKVGLDRELAELVFEAADAINDMIDACERGELLLADRVVTEKFDEYLRCTR